MKLKDIVHLSSKNDSEINLCKIAEHSNTGITFIVDEGLSKPKYHWPKSKGIDVATWMLRNKQIDDESLHDIIKCSFANNSFAFIGSDTLYRCFIQCFAEHRPLVLRPDVIWLIICQTLTNHINENAEQYRDQIVNHEGKIDIVVETKYNLADKRTNWSKLLNGFYTKIDENTKNGIANKIVSDFSTTKPIDRICSIATLMHGVESYFTYIVGRHVCGIPFITLQGTQEDWSHLLKKASVLKEYGLSNWYRWLAPILKEFVRAASGKPHLDFWKSIVQIAHEEDFSDGRGCVPDRYDVDGWCVALFPHISRKTRKINYDRCFNTDRMMSETIRVGFKYKEINPNNGNATMTSMELWSGIVGVKEDRKTYALTPKVGWFVRKSHEHDESLNRLKGANSRRGIELEIDEVPEILNELESFSALTLKFKNKVSLPEWIFSKPIERFIISGQIDEEYKNLIKSKFEKVCINEDPYKFDWGDEEEEEEETEEPVELYGHLGGVSLFGISHNIPVNDMNATAKKLSERLQANIELYTQKRYSYNKRKRLISFVWGYEDDVELGGAKNDAFRNTVRLEVCEYEIEKLKEDISSKCFSSLRYDKEVTERMFKSDFLGTSFVLYSFYLEGTPIKISAENIHLYIQEFDNYYRFEKKFHNSEGDSKAKLIDLRKKAKEVAKLSGCKEFIICPSYGPTYEIYRNQDLKTEKFIDYVKNRKYNQDYSTSEDYFEQWKSNEKHINFQDYVDGKVQINDNDFISVIFDKID